MPSTPSMLLMPILSTHTVLLLALALAVLLGLLLARRSRVVRRLAGRVLAGAGVVCAFLGALAADAERGLQRLLAATLRWPPANELTNETNSTPPTHTMDTPDMRTTGLTGATTPVRDGAPRASLAALPGAASSPYAEQPETAERIAVAAAPPAAWGGVVILSRLIGLALATCILLGEYTVNVLRVPIVQYGIVTSPPSGLLGVGVTAGLLYMAMSMLWGVIVLDLLDVVPRNVQLFPFLAPRLRRIFTVLGVIGFALTVLAAGLLYYAGQRIVDGTPLPAVADVLSPLQGVLLNMIAVPAAWALLLGLLGALALLCALLIVLCALARLVFGFAGRLIVSMAASIAGNAATLWGVEDVGTRTVGYERLHSLDADDFDRSLVAQGGAPIPGEDQEEDQEMAQNNRITTIIGCAAAGARLATAIVQEANSLGSARTVLGYARLNPDRLVEAPIERPPTGAIRDLSSTRSEIRVALEEHGQEQVYPALVAGLTERLVALHEPGRLGEGQIVWVDEVRNLPRTAPALRQLKARLVRRTIIVVAFLPTPGLEDALLEEGRAQLRALHADGVIAVTLYVDPRSPLASCVGENQQERLLVRWLTGQFDAHLHDLRNARLAETALALGKQGYATALGLETALVVGGASPWLYSLARPLFGGPRRGVSDIEDAFNQSVDLTKRLALDKHTRTFGAAATLDPSRAPILAITCIEPFHARDARVRVLTERFRTWLIGWQPMAQATIVCGDGAIAMAPGKPTEYGVLVGCWFTIEESDPWRNGHRAPAENGHSAPTPVSPSDVKITTEHHLVTEQPALSAEATIFDANHVDHADNAAYLEQAGRKEGTDRLATGKRPGGPSSVSGASGAPGPSASAIASSIAAPAPSAVRRATSTPHSTRTTNKRTTIRATRVGRAQPQPSEPELQEDEENDEDEEEATR